MQEDKLVIGGQEFQSRFILGSGKYSLNLIEAAIRDAGAEIITLALRRANTKERENILDYIPKGVTLLPNTSGARNAEEAVRIARLARELGCGDFVKADRSPEHDDTCSMCGKFCAVRSMNKALNGEYIDIL